jgi:hypothetical protein
MTAIAMLLYGGTMGVGLLARTRGARFGAWHHLLYALVFAAVLAAAATHYHPALWLTLAALAALPLAPARTAWHPLLATTGFAGLLARVAADPTALRAW